jgi:hypothetical protein
LEGLADVLSLKIWIGVEDLLMRHPVGDHADDRRDGNPQTADARDSIQLLAPDCDAGESHALRLIPLGDDR